MDEIRPAAGLVDPYKNPELFRWLDSLEGVPDWLGPAETNVERESWSAWQRRGNHFFGLVGTTLPGLVLAFLIAMSGRLLAELPTAALGFDKTPLSPILVAILLGLLLRNAIGLPTVYEAGLQLALKKVLRIGVALLGIRLSLAATGAIGLVALIFYPYLGHTLFDGNATLIGLFMGTAIHDTAQVAGAGMVYLAQYGTPDVLDTATVTKLQRNMFMLAVIPLMAYYSNRSRSSGSIRSQIRAALPMFVFGFLAMSLLRTVGDLGDRPFGIMTPEVWTMLIGWATKTATLCLAVAMAAVGLGTSFTRLRGLGFRPLAVGLFAAAVVGGVSYILIRTFSSEIIAWTS